MTTLPKRGRWVALSAYLGALVLTQFCCYVFAPVLPLLAARYRVSAGTAGWTVMIFPLVSVLTSGIAGRMVDRLGYRFSIRAGLLSITFFSCLRACGGGFALLLFSQAGIALGIPLVVTSLSPFVSARFDKPEQPSVTALGTVSLFAGIGLALGVSPRLVLAAGFQRTMIILAGIAVLSSASFFFASQEEPVSEAPGTALHASWLSLLRNRNVLLLCAGGFLGQGCFNAITTWIAVIWHARGFPLRSAGTATSGLVFAGILSSLLIPSVAHRLVDAKIALWFCLIPSVALVQPFIWTNRLSDAYAYGGLLGFFQLPSLAISLALLDRSVPREQSGAAAGLYWAIGNTGVFAVTFLIDWIHRFSGWHVAVRCVTALLAIVVLLVAFLRVPSRAAGIAASA